MTCPHCHAPQTSRMSSTTDLGYPVFRCRVCRRKFNERTGTPFNHLESPTDIVFQVLLCRFRYKLSLRNLAELFLLRGFEFTHKAVQEWEARFASFLAEQLRRKRQGKAGSRWYVDETYLKVKGRWCYLYRAIDHDGNLVDSLLSSTRDMAAAQRFFQSALSVADRIPQQVTTDGHDSYPRAIREVLSTEVEHRNNAYLNRRIEQDHRGIKQRYYPMLGFDAFPSAQRFCRTFEEVRQYFRPRRKRKQFVSLARARQQFIKREFEKGQDAASRRVINRIMAMWISASVVWGSRS
jgi:putative transposase